MGELVPCNICLCEVRDYNLRTHVKRCQKVQAMLLMASADAS